MVEPVFGVAVHAAGLGPGDGEVADVVVVEVLAAAQVADLPLSTEVDANAIGLVALDEGLAVAAGLGQHSDHAFVGDAGILLRR